MDVLVHPAEHVWSIQFSNGWQYTSSRDAAEDAKRQGLTVVGYVPTFIHRGAVGAARLAREQVATVLAITDDGRAGVLREALRLLDAAIGGQSETPPAFDENHAQEAPDGARR